MNYTVENMKKEKERKLARDIALQIHKLEVELHNFDAIAVAVDETIQRLKNNNGKLFMEILKKSL